MKRIITLSFIFCLSLLARGQEASSAFIKIEQAGKAEQGFRIDQGQKVSKQQQIMSAKIAFFTAEMGLTPQEAAAFWPVYNQYWEERENAHRRVQRNLEALRIILEDKRPDNEERLKKMLDAYINSQAIQGMIYRKYYEEFQKVLPIEKVARIYKAEEDFRIKLIYELRNSGEKQKH